MIFKEFKSNMINYILTCFEISLKLYTGKTSIAYSVKDPYEKSN